MNTTAVTRLLHKIIMNVGTMGLLVKLKDAELAIGGPRGLHIFFFSCRTEFSESDFSGYFLYHHIARRERKDLGGVPEGI